MGGFFHRQLSRANIHWKLRPASIADAIKHDHEPLLEAVHKQTLEARRGFHESRLIRCEMAFLLMIQRNSMFSAF